MYHRSLTRWFISLGDNSAVCESCICTSCLSFKFHTPSVITKTHANTHLIRDAQIYFFRLKHTPFSHLTEILRGVLFPPFFDKWFLPVSVGLWIGIISKITLGREPQSWIWESFDCWSRKKNVSQQWEKNASCIKNIYFLLSLYGGILKKLWNFQCIPALAFLVFPFFPVCLCTCTGCGVFLFATWTTAHLHTIIQSAPVEIPLSPRSNSSEVCKSFFYC